MISSLPRCVSVRSPVEAPDWENEEEEEEEEAEVDETTTLRLVVRERQRPDDETDEDEAGVEDVDDKIFRARHDPLADVTPALRHVETIAANVYKLSINRVSPVSGCATPQPCRPAARSVSRASRSFDG